MVKKTSTNLKTLITDADYSRKGLLKTYKNNLEIESELSHLINFLDNNKELQTKEFDEFKSEICLTGLKNKSSQITCLLDE